MSGENPRSRSRERDVVFGSGGARNGNGGGGGGNPLSVYCGGIPYDFDDNQLRDIFVSIGVITGVKVIKEHETGKPKGYGFVTFESEREVDLAITRLNGTELANGRRIAVSRARGSRPTPGHAAARDGPAAAPYAERDRDRNGRAWSPGREPHRERDGEWGRDARRERERSPPRERSPARGGGWERGGRDDRSRDDFRSRDRSRDRYDERDRERYPAPRSREPERASGGGGSWEARRGASPPRRADDRYARASPPRAPVPPPRAPAPPPYARPAADPYGALAPAPIAAPVAWAPGPAALPLPAQSGPHEPALWERVRDFYYPHRVDPYANGIGGFATVPAPMVVAVAPAPAGGYYVREPAPVAYAPPPLDERYGRPALPPAATYPQDAYTARPERPAAYADPYDQQPYGSSGGRAGYERERERPYADSYYAGGR